VVGRADHRRGCRFFVRQLQQLRQPVNLPDPRWPVSYGSDGKVQLFFVGRARIKMRQPRQTSKRSADANTRPRDVLLASPPSVFASNPLNMKRLTVPIPSSSRDVRAVALGRFFRVSADKKRTFSTLLAHV
jgi:hypothetical protein